MVASIGGTQGDRILYVFEPAEVLCAMLSRAVTRESPADAAVTAEKTKTTGAAATFRDNGLVHAG